MQYNKPTPLNILLSLSLEIFSSYPATVDVQMKEQHSTP